MKSPTSSIMHSIQALKAKLRNDHLELQGLRRDFAMGPTRSIVQIQQRSQSPLLNHSNHVNIHNNIHIANNYKTTNSTSVQKHLKTKLLQLRKANQKQLKTLIQNHKKQKQQLVSLYQNKIQQVTGFFQDKIKEQQDYIHLLQESLEGFREQQDYVRRVQDQIQVLKNKNKDLEQYMKTTVQELKRKQCQNKQRVSQGVNTAELIKTLKLCHKIYQISCTQMTFVNKIQFMTFQSSNPNTNTNSNPNTNQIQNYDVVTITQSLTQKNQVQRNINSQIMIGSSDSDSNYGSINNQMLLHGANNQKPNKAYQKSGPSLNKNYKYQNIVNNLLRQNAQLLQTVQRLKMENRKLIYDSISKDEKQTQKNQFKQNNKKNNQFTNKINVNMKIHMKNRPSEDLGKKNYSPSSQYYSINHVSSDNMNQSSYRQANSNNNVNGGCAKKNRLKFSKASQNRFKSNTDRSFLSVNNENIDISNIKYRDANSIERQEKQQSIVENSIVQEQQESIMSQQMKLKTIKHFMKVISHHSTQAEQYSTQSLFRPKFQAKKSSGIRNTLKSVSALQGI